MTERWKATTGNEKSMIRRMNRLKMVDKERVVWRIDELLAMPVIAEKIPGFRFESVQLEIAKFIIAPYLINTRKFSRSQA